jgi:hypothetical protein
MTARALSQRARRTSLLVALLLGAVVAMPAAAQFQVTTPAKGEGTVTVALQNLFIADHTDYKGTHNPHGGSITTNSAFFNVEYGLTDRWALSVGLPFRSSKFVGPPNHDPAHLDDDHGQYFQDDGDFHAGWQDWSLSLRYAWVRKKWLVTPYLLYGTPARDYNTFAHSAVGVGQWRLEAGISAGRQFSGPLRNLYFVGGAAYALMEPVDRRVNHATLSGELGYFINPKLSVHVNVLRQKTYNGFDFPIDFPNNHDDHFFHHDQNLRNDYVNAGIGVDWQATDRDHFYISHGRTLHGDNTHIIKAVVTVGYSRDF